MLDYGKTWEDVSWELGMKKMLLLKKIEVFLCVEIVEK